MDSGAPIEDATAAHASLRSASDSSSFSGSGGAPSSGGGFGSGGDPGSGDPRGGGQQRVLEVPEESHQVWVESTSRVAP
jgi:hypothetical protein